MSTSHETIIQLTSLLRTGTESFWAALRALLRERGVDPTTTLLVFSVEQDTDSEIGVLLTSDHKIYEVSIDLGQSLDLPRIAAWNDLTDSWRDSPFRRSVETGIELLGSR